MQFKQTAPQMFTCFVQKLKVYFFAKKCLHKYSHYAIIMHIETISVSKLRIFFKRRDKNEREKGK